MTLPSLLLGFTLATLYGTAFHFWRGGGGKRLLLYILLSWTGFWVGQFVASKFHWTFLPLGTLQLGTATGGSVLVLLIGHWLSYQKRAL